MNNVEIINGNPLIIEIQTPGPQGRKGDTPDVSGLLEKDIFYNFTSSYNTGSFSGSYVGFFKGELDSSVLATSSSHALKSISSSFSEYSSQSLNSLSSSQADESKLSISSSFLFGEQITQVTGSSESLLMSQKSITYYLENIPIDGGNAFTVYN